MIKHKIEADNNHRAESGMQADAQHYSSRELSTITIPPGCLATVCLFQQGDGSHRYFRINFPAATPVPGKKQSLPPEISRQQRLFILLLACECVCAATLSNTPHSLLVALQKSGELLFPRTRWKAFLLKGSCESAQLLQVMMCSTNCGLAPGHCPSKQVKLTHQAGLLQLLPTPNVNR